jgi:hypothetical protein
MSVRGTIAVDVAFTDSTTTASSSSLNTITLRDATEYTTGKVAIVTGTVGTTQVSVNTTPTTYRDASGAFISFSNISRVAFSASGSQVVEVLSNDSGRSLAASMSSMVAVASCNVFGSLDIQFPTATAGTAFYTLVMYGT